MHIHVRFFAITRERAGRAEHTLDLPDAATVGDAWEALVASHPSLAPLRDHLRFAVNHDFASLTHALQDGDELALIPPVSGGAPRCALTETPIDTDAVVRSVRRPDAGALVVFEGVVRDHTGDRRVAHLEYEVYPEMALAKLREVATQAETTWPACHVAVTHRTGRLEIGEASIVIAVSSPHRKAAFEACAWTIDRIKEVVPIWKKEVGPDGAEWVGMGS